MSFCLQAIKLQPAIIFIDEIGMRVFFYLKTFINFKYVLVNEIYFSQLLDIVFINL